MLGGAVPLVIRPTETGKLAVQFPHDPIPGDLCDDGGGGNGETEGVAFDHREAAALEAGTPVAVDQGKIGVHLVRSAGHRHHGRLKNVQLIDFLDGCPADPDLGEGSKSGQEFLALVLF